MTKEEVPLVLLLTTQMPSVHQTRWQEIGRGTHVPERPITQSHPASDLSEDPLLRRWRPLWLEAVMAPGCHGCRLSWLQVTLCCRCHADHSLIFWKSVAVSCLATLVSPTTPT